jgi:hypothetical protein
MVFPSKYALSALLALAVAGCAAVLPIAKAMEQAACAIVPVFLPSTTTLVASVCADAAPAVNTVISEVVTADGTGASLASYSASTCKMVPISADGSTGRGEICSSFCGDMSTATATDPCPKVDAKLKAASKKAAH